MKHLALCLCLAAVGCGDTMPADIMQRFASMLNSAKYAYIAVCYGREGEPECVTMHEHTNALIEEYTAINKELAE